jgi:hypothetical protein
VSRNLLVVLLNDASLEELHDAVEHAAGDGRPRVYVVAPAHVGPLHWLATDEQSARDQAGVRALEAEWILADEASVGGAAGDADPTLAVEDALRSFKADEILLVGGTAADQGLRTSLAPLGVPVTWVGPPPGKGRKARLRGLTSGRSNATPFVAFVTANVALLLIGVAITIAVLLILWAAGYA